MVESKSKHDVLTDSRIAYIGDDTGLIKKVKIVAKRIEETQTISYDQGIPKRRKIDENGNEIVFTQRPSVLTAADNITNVRHQTDLSFKLLAKFGQQEKDQGILCLGWVKGETNLSFVRGSENIVQVFDTRQERVIKQRQYKEDQSLIVGLHSIADGSFQHAIVGQKGDLTFDDLAKKVTTSKPIQMKGSHIHKSYLANDKIIALSKSTTLQVWDINTSKQYFQAKNVPHDELDLEVPIFDTGLTFIDSSMNLVAVCTGYGAVRHYDFRAGKRPRSNAQVLKNEMLISHIVQSQVNSHQLYIVDQLGCVHVLDQRFNCRLIRKMPGAKGSVRDCQIFGNYQNQEFLATVGCDRYLRVFDASKELQSQTQCGTAYLKQKLNCILMTPKQGTQ